MAANNKTLFDYFAASYGEMYRQIARRFKRDVDADDVLQDTYLKLQCIPRDTTIKNPRAYLFRMANNLATDTLRSRRAIERYVQSGEISDALDDGPSAERIVDFRQRLDRIEKAVQELPPRQRQVFLMHKYDGMSHTQIATTLGISKSAVEKLIMKALASLRDQMGDLLE